MPSVAGSHCRRAASAVYRLLLRATTLPPTTLPRCFFPVVVLCCRAKRRNMERLSLACGGFAVNSVEELSEDCLVRSTLSSRLNVCGAV